MRWLTTLLVPREILIQCERCEGKGKTALSPVLTATLRSIPKRGYVTVGELTGPLHATREAVAMRLLDLWMMHLVGRERDPGEKAWRYSRA